MKSRIWITLVSSLLLGTGMWLVCETKDDKKFTDFIIGMLKKADEKNWCATFPGGTICDPYWKYAMLKKGVWIEHDRPCHVEIKDKISRVNFMRNYMELKNKRDNYGPIRTDIWVKGPKAIEEFEKRIGVSLTTDESTQVDSCTSCNIFSTREDYDGILTRMYSCQTDLPYDQFVEEMNKE